jgi:HAD superfamily hydrolase (TIGR01509 family)
MQKNKNLVIFDCDGVLVDSETITNQVLVDYIGEFGVEISLEKALELFRGGALSDWIRYAQLEFNVELPDEFTSNFRHRLKVSFERDLKPVEGVVQLIESIEGPICVASNGPHEKMDTSLAVTGILPYFKNRIFSAYDIGKWKPDPALFLHAAKQMNVKPENCIVIEDSPRGIEAATAAGMKSYGYDVYGKTQALIDNGAQTFTKMTDLIGKVG